MYAILTDRNGTEIDRYTLTDTDLLDCDRFADIFANGLGIELEGEAPDSRIPDGCEDYTVTLTEDPQGVRCWSRANYMIKNEEY